MKRLVFLLLIVILWEGVYRLGIWPDFMFPSPSSVAETIIDGFAKGTYLSALLNSLRRLIIGYAIAVIVGTTIGALMIASKTIDETLGFLIIAFQSVPSVVWLPLVLLWFNTGESAIISVVVLGGIWNMIMSAHTGLKNVDRDLIKCGKNLGYKGFRLFTKIMIPASVPHLITGMRLAWAFCWRALMAAEILGTGTGLGQTLMWGKEMGNMSTVLAVMFIIGTTGLISDNLMFKKIETKVYRKWGLIN